MTLAETATADTELSIQYPCNLVRESEFHSVLGVQIT